MVTYNTVAEAVNDLVRRGYTFDFRKVKSDHPEWLQDNKHLRPDEFVINELYRFEGPTDPADESLVLAISSAKHNVKGTLVNAFGPYGEPGVSELSAKLPESNPLQSHRQLKPG